MDKIKLHTLGPMPQSITNLVQIGEVEVEVNNSIPYETVLDMIQWCINFIVDDRPFISAPLKRVVSDFAIVKFYTNLDIIGFDGPNFDMTRVYEDYDLLRAHGAFDKIREHIAPDQLKFFTETLEETMASIIAYRNSAQGIVDALTAEANNNTEALQAALDQMKDPDQLGTVEHLMDIVQTLGMPK